MYQLGFEEAEEPEIKLPTLAGSYGKQGNSRKTSTSALLTTPKLLIVWITTNCGKFFKRWEYQKRIRNQKPLKKPIRRSGSNSSNWTWNTRLVPNRKRSTSRLYIVTLLFYFYAEYIMRNAGLKEAEAGIKTVRRNINNL